MIEQLNAAEIVPFKIDTQVYRPSLICLKSRNPN